MSSDRERLRQLVYRTLKYRRQQLKRQIKFWVNDQLYAAKLEENELMVKLIRDGIARDKKRQNAAPQSNLRRPADTGRGTNGRRARANVD